MKVFLISVGFIVFGYLSAVAISFFTHPAPKESPKRSIGDNKGN